MTGGGDNKDDISNQNANTTPDPPQKEEPLCKESDKDCLEKQS